MSASDLAGSRERWPTAVDFSDQARHSLVNAAVLALASARRQGDEYLPEGALNKHLTDKLPRLVQAAKQCLGGVGWLEQLLDSDRRIAQGNVEGIDELCYSLATDLPP